MTYIFDIKEADINICKDADTFLQSLMWGLFKSRFGWTAKAFLVDWGQEKLPLLVLVRTLVRGFSFAYVPWGPELPATIPEESRSIALAQLAGKLKQFLVKNTAFVRFEPPWFYTGNKGQENKGRENTFFLATGFREAAATVQPPDTVILDLKASSEEILSSMKPKWRYNISLSRKKGVEVNLAVERELDIFYGLLKETAARDGIAVHSFEYYQTLFEICKEHIDNKINLYIAKHENDILASIIVLFRGKYATYLYGASSNLKRDLMASYALQWKAIQDAKEAGCLYYDFFGIPPCDDPNHPMAGLYRFKTGFGGQIVHRPGSWDYVYKPFFYTFFSMAEGIRKKLRDIRKKR